MRVILAFAAAAALLVPVSAPANADLTGLTVTSIVLKDDGGKPWPKPEKFLPLIEVATGDRFSRSRIRRGVEYLYLKGLFRDIRVEAFPDNGGVRLEYTLVPMIMVSSVVIAGNKVISTDRLRDVVGKLEGGEFRADRLPPVRLDLFLLYQAEGYFGVKVDFRAEPAGEPNRVRLRVQITEGEPTLLEEIRFQGNTVFSGKELLGVMKSEKGEPIRVDDLFEHDTQAIVQKYTDAGYPSPKMKVVNVRFSDRKAFVTLAGSEGPKVTVRFTGNKEFSRSDLSRNLLIWSEHDVSDAVLESSVEKIKDLYRERGFVDVKVEMRKSAGPGRLDLEFEITEGPRVAVDRIVFEGNRAFRDKDLRRLMETGESGLFHSSPLRENVLRRDLDAVRDRYIDAGYLSADVEKKVALDRRGTSATVTVMVAEGPRTVVGSVILDGNAAVPSSDLLPLLRLKPGSVFSERIMDEDRYRLLAAYSAKGYLYGKVEVERTVAPKPAGTAQPAGDTAIDLTYRISEDKPVTVGKIILRGNERTRDEVIEREVIVRSGDRYNYENILRSQQQIYRLSFIGTARFEPLRPAERGYVKDMLLTISERPAGAVEFGVGYGDLDLLRGFAEVSHRNVFGRALSASFRVEASDIRRRAILNFQEPWFLGTRLDNRLSVVWSDEDRINSETRDIYYSTRKTVVSYGFERMVSRLRASLIYQFERVDNYDIAPGAAPSKEDEGRVRISSLTPGLILDRRNDLFNPTAGSVHGIAVKEAIPAIGSEADFTKLTLQSSWFVPLFPKVMAALSARAGISWPHGETTEMPLHERFYLGGGTTVRGYTQDSVGPTGTDGTPQGGESMLLGNFEFRINPAGGFGVVLFTDAGNVWDDQSIRISDLRASYGGGIRYNTPVGPLRVDYGQKINRQPGESPGEVHFSLGHVF